MGQAVMSHSGSPGGDGSLSVPSCLGRRGGKSPYAPGDFVPAATQQLPEGQSGHVGAREGCQGHRAGSGAPRWAPPPGKPGGQAPNQRHPGAGGCLAGPRQSRSTKNLGGGGGRRVPKGTGLRQSRGGERGLFRQMSSWQAAARCVCPGRRYDSSLRRKAAAAEVAVTGSARSEIPVKSEPEPQRRGASGSAEAPPGHARARSVPAAGSARAIPPRPGPSAPPPPPPLPARPSPGRRVLPRAKAGPEPPRGLLRWRRRRRPGPPRVPQPSVAARSPAAQRWGAAAGGRWLRLGIGGRSSLRLLGAAGPRAARPSPGLLAVLPASPGTGCQTQPALRSETGSLCLRLQLGALGGSRSRTWGARGRRTDNNGDGGPVWQPRGPEGAGAGPALPAASRSPESLLPCGPWKGAGVEPGLPAGTSPTPPAPLGSSPVLGAPRHPKLCSPTASFSPPSPRPALARAASSPLGCGHSGFLPASPPGPQILTHQRSPPGPGRLLGTLRRRRAAGAAY